MSHLFRRQLRLTQHFRKCYMSQAILGIETSCDDTGAAVIDCEDGKVLGEALNNQQKTHTLLGGINPTVARDLHAANIENVVQEAMEKANMSFRDLTAIATTVKPGLGLALQIGTDYGKKLSIDNRVPFIPIHHMEAHVLTVRMLTQVEFPFLCLLVSGGHCLIVLVKDIDQYSILGQSIDDAPGECFDKGGRLLNLRSIKSFQATSGGVAIEHLAKDGDPNSFTFTKISPMSHYRDCDFSFAAFKSSLEIVAQRLEEENGLDGDTALPSPLLNNICASYQRGVFQHIIRKTHRALLYIENIGAIPSDHPKKLVVSGGVASNSTLRQWLQKLCDKVGGYDVICPPAELCTDNGVMVAWNGVERWRRQKGVIRDPLEISKVDIMPKCPLGENLSKDIRAMDIRVKKWIKM